MPKKLDVQRYDRNMSAPPPKLEGFRWHSPLLVPFRMVGFGWFKKEKLYRRMPLHPRFPLPEAVEVLADCASGGQIQFQTDTLKIGLRVQLRSTASFYHMAPTGQNGFDLYFGPPKDQRYLKTTFFDTEKSSYECLLFSDSEKQMRNFTLNLPLYQPIESISIGLASPSKVLAPPPFDQRRKVAVYGTSITQGGCASRPGMAWTNILSRRLNVEFINLGFSGSGRGEAEVAHVISKVPQVGAFVLDYEANCTQVEKFYSTLPSFVAILRKAHPKTPILIISKIPYAFEHREPGLRIARRDFQQNFVGRQRRLGDKKIFFFDSSKILGANYDECTVDGIHPTDLGFMRMADGLTPAFKKLLKEIA